MRGVILVTDLDWFEFLRAQPELDEVNFWRPSDTRKPQQLSGGMPVLFKLRKRHGGWIVGWGTFARHEVLPAWLAWEAFEERNGARSFVEMRARIERLRHDGGAGAASGGDYAIGCLMLERPLLLLPREAYVRPPADWPDNVVQGKGYDLDRGEGARVWRELTERLPLTATVAGAGAEERDRYGTPMLVAPRRGQGIFRVAVTEAYRRACAVSGEHSLPALEAAHIRPFAEQGPHDVTNGLLLRSDIHRLFDKGYVGVTPEYRFVVSRRLRDDFENGRSYYGFDTQAIHLPTSAAERPSREALEWHMRERWRG